MNHDNPIRELNVSYDFGKGMKSMKGEIEKDILYFQKCRSVSTGYVTAFLKVYFKYRET